MTNMNSTEIVKAFLTKLPKHGGWLTMAQTRWLYDVARNEELYVGNYTVKGQWTEADETLVTWTLWRSPNKSGSLKVDYYTQDDYNADILKDRYEARCRIANPRMMDCVMTGDIARMTAISTWLRDGIGECPD